MDAHPAHDREVAAVTPPSVFLTGFPGFLGSALLERLLDRGDGPIACLVQPNYLRVAERRAREITSRVDSAAEVNGGSRREGDAADRAIRLYEGDITEPDLGLDHPTDEFDAVREVYHLAAVYDLGVDRDLATAVNVEGTHNVLSFADALDVEAFHYVSTCYVSGRYDGVFTESHLREGQSFNNHYEETKYRAEVLVQDRMDEGFPATVYRPAIVVGDAETGNTDKFDGPYNLLRLLCAQPRVAVLFAPPGVRRTELNVVPRNVVVDAIAYLSDRNACTGEVYQLCDPSPLSVPAFVSALAEAVDRRVLTVPAPEPIVERAMNAFDALGSLGPFGTDVDPHTLAYLTHPTRYANPATRRALRGSGIRVPPFESYVDELVAFARSHPELEDEPMV